jgi:hypothetical protein
LEPGPARQNVQVKGQGSSRTRASHRVGQRKPQRDPVKNSDVS